NLPALEHARVDAAELGRGGYVLREAAAGTKTPVTLIATGSEVWLAMDAAKLLDQSGIAARVVSMPAPQLFLQQDAGWREAVLPRGGRFVSLEAGATDYWHRFVGPDGLTIGIDTFGESAPLAQLQEHFGFTPARVATRVAEWAGAGR